MPSIFELHDNKPGHSASIAAGQLCLPRAYIPDPDVVLSELHHRWFNALTVLSASLRLCALERRTSSEILFRLGAIDSQIQSMAAMHRRLYDPPPEPESVEGYCRALCIDVVLAHGREEVTPWIEMCDILLPRRTLRGLGGIVVELMTNALKHGRAPKEGGVVWMRARELPSGWLELAVTDNFKPPVAVPAAPKMVEALVGDLGGSLTVQLAPGYTTRIRLPGK